LRARLIIVLMDSMLVGCIALFLVSIVVPIINIGIPPFTGNTLCRSLLHLTRVDVCCLKVPSHECDSIHSIISLNVIRFLNCIVTALCFVATALEGAHMIIYEVFLAIDFIKERLKRMKAEIWHANSNGAFRAIISEYKKFQILGQVFNSIYKTNVFGMYVVCLSFIVVASGYFFLIMYKVSSMVQSLSGILTIVTYSVLFVLTNVASQWWTQSGAFKSECQRNLRLVKNPIIRRTGFALVNLRVNIGSVNFAESLTPLVILAFCVEQTISLALLKD
jgi:hypothetical protein